MSKREEMQAIISNGGSVLHRGVLYSKNNPLPSEAELAKGDKAAEEVAKVYIKEQIAYYQAQLDLLNDSVTAEPKKEAVKEVEAVAPKKEETKPSAAGKKDVKKISFED